MPEKKTTVDHLEAQCNSVVGLAAGRPYPLYVSVVGARGQNWSIVGTPHWNEATTDGRNGAGNAPNTGEATSYRISPSAFVNRLDLVLETQVVTNVRYDTDKDNDSSIPLVLRAALLLVRRTPGMV